MNICDDRIADTPGHIKVSLPGENWPNWRSTVLHSQQLSAEAFLWKKAFYYWGHHHQNCWETRNCQTVTWKRNKTL